MENQPFLCSTCGVEYAPAPTPPQHCKICEDERQYVNPKGQSWTTLTQVNKSYKNIIEKVAPEIYAIYSTPSFAIGQRAHLLITPQGNILWDCIANLDETTIDLIGKIGGIDAIAISHPHYYSTVEKWSKAFGNVPVYIHKKDKEWLGRTDFNLVLWDEEQKLIREDITLINCGGHFDGATVLHYKDILLVGDVIQICPDLKSVSVMYSYPNYIPLAQKDVLYIQKSLKDFDYNRMYGAFGHYLRKDAQQIMQFSMERYLKIYK
ncbi:beta-lactamase [Pedobacter lusitanus]|uniref:Beta-lactamase n=1 Tax=Pedobacter lusitanus TaxID=1503925 RepID=A0A0D0GQ44_9SPHI|nr:MBL fold metallo-hydrolase [Pedobacter lusitanus]KIO78285.1 beta-lactamase [Pedobacter lusitanus]